MASFSFLLRHQLYADTETLLEFKVLSEQETSGRTDPSTTKESNVVDQNHPWWWIGLQPILEGQDPGAVTQTLLQFSQGKVSYPDADQFLKACNVGHFTGGKCDFLGGPDTKFTTMGAHVLEVLQELGMKETSRVLEVGVGLSRVSRDIIDYLDEGRYMGIEPNGDMLAVGVAHRIGYELLEEKKPRYSTNTDFDFSVFGDEKIDVVTSRSVWTHTSKVQTEQYLKSFARVASPGAFIATTIIRITENCGADYNGATWVGKSHEDDDVGIAQHCMPWIRAACEREGLQVKILQDAAPGLVRKVDWNDQGQPWIVIQKK